LRELVRDAVLAPGGLVKRKRHDGRLGLWPHSVPQIRLAAADLLERLLTALLVQLLEAIETVAAVPHDPTRLGHIPKLFRQIENPNLRLDDLLRSRHPSSSGDCQITS
jgi:hypothetical protein